MFNQVNIMGRICQEVRSKMFGERMGVQFQLAYNERYQDRQGEWKEKSVFVHVQAWGRMAEVVNEFGRVGAEVIVLGKLAMKTWQARDGRKCSAVIIDAQMVQFTTNAIELKKTRNARANSEQAEGKDPF